MTHFDETSYELLSAYLDGELPADDCARVEALLNSSDEHRTLYEDLKSLRGRFAEVPKQTASPQLKIRIMDAIAAVESPPTPRQGAESEVEPVAELERPETERNWVAGLVRLAIAASLLIGTWAAYRAMNPEPNNNNLLVGPGGQPDEVPENVGPGPETPNESGFVFQEVACDILTIFDFEVEPRLLENDTFKNTLKMHGIDVNETIIPDDAAQKAILDSAAFGVSEKGKRGQVQFSIVIAHIDKLTLIFESLNSVEGVKKRQMDMSVNPADIQMMRALERSRRAQFRDAKKQAYFVSMGGDLQNALFGPTSALMKLEGLGAASDLGKPPARDAQRIVPAAFILRATAD